MSAHTKGPWEIHLGYDNTGYPCFYIHGMAGDQKRDIPVLTANAKLIAAAPELLEALRPFAKFACDEPCECHNCRARAAVAKAIGEA